MQLSSEQTLIIETTKRFAEERLAPNTAKWEDARALELGTTEGVKFERRLFHVLFGSADQKEGMDAFINKRDAKFGG